MNTTEQAPIPATELGSDERWEKFGRQMIGLIRNGWQMRRKSTLTNGRTLRIVLELHLPEK